MKILIIILEILTPTLTFVAYLGWRKYFQYRRAYNALQIAAMKRIAEMEAEKLKPDWHFFTAGVCAGYWLCVFLAWMLRKSK